MKNTCVSRDFRVLGVVRVQERAAGDEGWARGAAEHEKCATRARFSCLAGGGAVVGSQ